MGALCNQTPLVEDQDAIYLAHRGEPVDDDDAGAVRHQFLQGELDQTLALRVERTGGLVERAGIPVALISVSGKHCLSLFYRRPPSLPPWSNCCDSPVGCR